MPENRSSSKGQHLHQRVWLEALCEHDGTVLSSRQMLRSEAEAFLSANPNNFNIEAIDSELIHNLFD